MKQLLMLLAHTVISNLLFPLYAILCSLLVHDSLFLLEKLVYEEFCREKKTLREDIYKVSQTSTNFEQLLVLLQTFNPLASDDQGVACRNSICIKFLLSVPSCGLGNPFLRFCSEIKKLQNELRSCKKSYLECRWTVILIL